MTEWTPLLDVMRGGYAAGFDRYQQYEWKRAGSENVWIMRLDDMDPLFNVWGLSFRKITRAKAMDELIAGDADLL